jgi:hypothetical protein
MTLCLTLIAILLLTSCAAVHRAPATLASIRTAWDALRGAQRATIDAMIDGLARRVMARGAGALFDRA